MKTYIEPSMEILALELENMIAMSVTGADDLDIADGEFEGGIADGNIRGILEQQTGMSIFQ